MASLATQSTTKVRRRISQPQRWGYLGFFDALVVMHPEVTAMFLTKLKQVTEATMR